MLEAFRRAFKNDERQMKALTGLNSEEFEKLSKTFGEILTRENSINTRKRAIGGGSKHTLTLMGNKLNINQ